MDLTPQRIEQLRDVIVKRRNEVRDRDLDYKEIEVRAVTSAIHSAAGDGKGAEHASKFRFPRASDQGAKAPVKEASLERVQSLMGGAPRFSDEDLAAARARLEAGE